MVDGAKLLDAIYAIADEKKIDKEIVLEGIKEGFQKAYEKFFDPEAIVKVDIDEQSGQIKVAKELKVVKKIEDEWLEIGLNDAKAKYGESVSIDDTVYEPVIFDEEFSRLAVLQVGQIIKQKIREGEKQKVYDAFLSKNHEIVGGKIIDITDTSYLLDVDGSIIPLWNRKIIPGEEIVEGQRLIVYIEELNKDDKYSQIIATRVHPDFLAKLLETEVPEIAEGIVEVKAASREPGNRAKVAVRSYDDSVDPVGACVGTRGSRIKNVTAELNGEKIDIIVWDEDKKTFIINAMAPVRVISIELNEEERTASIVVPDEQLSLAIGKKGSSARLVANLVDCKINITSFSDAKEQDLPIYWNGNITQEELNDPDFINKVNQRRTMNPSNTRPKKLDLEDEIDESIYVSSSIDDIEANISAFEELVEETTEFEEDNFEDDYDKYYDN